MQSPEVVLSCLASKEPSYQFQRLYRNLYNREFFLIAYGNLAKKEGNMTKGINEDTIDGMSLKRIERTIESLKNLTYQPKPVRRVYIPKSSGSKRPLGIPAFEDKLVQEVVRMQLEAIYEPLFSNSSHGFRPKRSCHTALAQIQNTYTGVKWFIEGDIKSFFDNIDHHILIAILKRKIKDEKFIQLIWKFLRAGYLEDWKFNRTYSGTPQGGIISPILANIYLNELDKYMEQYAQTFHKGEQRKLNPKYGSLARKIWMTKEKLKTNQLIVQEKVALITSQKELYKEMHQTPYRDPMDGNYKRLVYTRYADDFIVGVIGSKVDTRKIKADLTEFLAKELKLELSQEKTLITHSNQRIRFLGYDIVISRSNEPSRDKNGAFRRSFNYKVKLYVPQEKWVGKLKELRVLRINKDNSWSAIHRAELIPLEDLEILGNYNPELMGLYNYYKLAHNVSVLNKFHYIMEYSFYKTLASKYKISMSKVIQKYKTNGTFTITYPTKSGTKKQTLYNKGYRRVKVVTKHSEIDSLPNTMKYGARTSLIDRLLAEKCEWCNSENVPLEVHHVRKVKDLKGKKNWERRMIERKRKTMVLCVKCHDDLHAGRLD